MLVYLAVMIMCSILLYATRNNNNKVTPLAITFGMIWLMIALQDGWGGDHNSYVVAFEHFWGMSLEDVLLDEYHGESGYRILLWLMPDSYTGLVLGMAIWCFSLAFFFYHFIPQKWWFLAILFVFFDKAILMGMVASFLRMALANSFLIFAFYLLCKRRKIIFPILLIVAGSFFHKSVLFMTPLVFIKARPFKIPYQHLLTGFVILAFIMMIFPSSWISFVENLVTSVDEFSGYEYYLEDQDTVQVKGVSLIVLFYWVYLLARQTNSKTLSGAEYFVLYVALFRIAFDILPAVGLSTRMFYYLDIYFFAGMMCVMNQLPKNSVHIYGIALTLLLMFWFFGFHAYSKTPFFREHWAFYNFVF